MHEASTKRSRPLRLELGKLLRASAPGKPSKRRQFFKKEELILVHYTFRHVPPKPSALDLDIPRRVLLVQFPHW